MIALFLFLSLPLCISGTIALRFLHGNAALGDIQVESVNGAGSGWGSEGGVTLTPGSSSNYTLIPHDELLFDIFMGNVSARLAIDSDGEECGRWTVGLGSALGETGNATLTRYNESDPSSIISLSIKQTNSGPQNVPRSSVDEDECIMLVEEGGPGSPAALPDGDTATVLSYILSCYPSSPNHPPPVIGLNVTLNNSTISSDVAVPGVGGAVDVGAGVYGVAVQDYNVRADADLWPREAITTSLLGGQVYIFVFFGLATEDATLRVEAAGVPDDPPCPAPPASQLLDTLKDFFAEHTTLIIVGAVCFYAGCCMCWVGYRMRSGGHKRKRKVDDDEGDVFLF